MKKLQARMALVGLAMAVVGCSKPATTGEAIARDEVAITQALKEKGMLVPPACGHKDDGKTYYVEGYPHWSEGNLCYNDDCGVRIYEANEADGSPAKGEQGYVELTAQLGKQIDEPQLNDLRVKLEGVTSGRSKTTLGALEKDSLALHLSDGSKVNNLVRIRAFFKIVDRNGVCQLAYAGGVKAP